MRSVVTIHPRIMERLEKTLALRVQIFESERGRVRQLIEGILDRVVRLETTSDLKLADCRGECGEALREVDALDVQATDGTEIDRLLQRVARVGFLLNGLDVSHLKAATSQKPA